MTNRGTAAFERLKELSRTELIEILVRSANFNACGAVKELYTGDEEALADELGINLECERREAEKERRERASEYNYSRGI